MKRKDYKNLKIEIDMISGKIFSSKGKKPSSTKSANSKHSNLLRDIFYPRSAKSISRMHPKSLSRSKNRKKLLSNIRKKQKLKSGQQSASSLSRSNRNGTQRTRMKGKYKTSPSRKILNERFGDLRFKGKRGKHRSLSGSRKRKEQYLMGNMANLKKRCNNKFFDNRKKSDWISDAYISKFSKTKREQLKRRMGKGGVKSLRNWRKKGKKKYRRGKRSIEGRDFVLTNSY